MSAGQSLEAEPRSGPGAALSSAGAQAQSSAGGDAGFLQQPQPQQQQQRFPAGFSSSKAFSQAAAFSKAYSSSFAVGPAGERRLLHRAFSESASNASRAFSASGSTADGGVYSESGAEAADGASGSDSSSSAFSSSSAGAGAASESGASSASRQSTSQSQSQSNSQSTSQSQSQSQSQSNSQSTSQSQAFSSSSNAGVDASSTSSGTADDVSSLLAQGQRVSESNSQASSSSGQSSSSSSSATASGGNRANFFSANQGGSSSSSFGESSFDAGHRDSQLSQLNRVTQVGQVGQVAQVGLLRPFVPLVEEVPIVPTYFVEEDFFLSTPVPVLEEVGIFPVEQIAGQFDAQNHQHNYQSTTAILNDKRRKPIQGYPSLATKEKFDVSSQSFGSANRGATQSMFGQSNAHSQSSAHFSSSQNRDESPVVLIGYQGKPKTPQQRQPYGASEHMLGSTHSVQGHRVGLNQADSIKNMLDAMQSAFTSGSSHSEAHRESHHSNSQDGGAQRITYEAVVTGEAPELLYQTHVNNGMKDGFQPIGSGHANINNIISHLTRDTVNRNEQRPYFVVQNDQTTSKFSEAQTGAVLSEKTPNRQKSGENAENDAEAGTSNSQFHHHAGVHTEKEMGQIDDQYNGDRKFVMLNGRKYSTDDLVREFNRTRPTFPPSLRRPPPNQASQAEATSSSFGLQPLPDDNHSKDTSPSNKGGFFHTFGKRYHDYVPPSLFTSTGFSKFFLDRFRRRHPPPPAPPDSVQATAPVPSALPGPPRRPSPPLRAHPSNYFIYPGTVSREEDLPDYVKMDLNIRRGFSLGSGSSSSASSSATSSFSTSSSS